MEVHLRTHRRASGSHAWKLRIPMQMLPTLTQTLQTIKQEEQNAGSPGSHWLVETEYEGRQYFSSVQEIIDDINRGQLELGHSMVSFLLGYRPVDTYRLMVQFSPDANPRGRGRVGPGGAGQCRVGARWGPGGAAPPGPHPAPTRPPPGPTLPHLAPPGPVRTHPALPGPTRHCPAPPAPGRAGPGGRGGGGGPDGRGRGRVRTGPGRGRVGAGWGRVGAGWGPGSAGWGRVGGWGPGSAGGGGGGRGRAGPGGVKVKVKCSGDLRTPA